MPVTLLCLHVNGESHDLAVPDHWTLLEALRYKLRLTGTKQGCDKGDCGACTVRIDGAPVLSCLTFAKAAQGRDIQTIEGVADADGPHPLQRAFDACGALQCGFCQPGMILSAKALLEENPDPTLPEMQEALSGNLCRCTGYTKIYEAIRMVADATKAGRQSARQIPMRYGEPAPGHLIIGARGRKADSIRKATGEAIYADDIQFPRMLHGKILRSLHAHARIRSVDTSAAEALPGVFAVATGQDAPVRYGIIPWTPDEYALAVDKVRYVGDAVAAVAAIDEETAIRALDLIRVDYEVLPALLDMAKALDADAPLVHDVDWKDRPRTDNLCKEVDLSFGEVDANIAAADAVVTDRWFYEGSNHAAIEPHCAVASWSPDGQLTLWSASQVTHYLHRELAKVLSVPPEKIRVIQPALGGAFGGKSEPFDLEFASAILAKKAGRPVKILYTREEVFYAHRGRHPMDMQMTVAGNRDGTITAVKSDILIDGGAYHSFGLVTSYYAGQLLPGPVNFGSYAFRARRVYTNKPACGPKRGHGSVQPRFAFEAAIDELALKLGLDPMELRLRNAMLSGQTTVNGLMLPSTGLTACLESVAAGSGWRDRYGKLPPGRGLGLACSMYISGTAYPIYPNDMPQSAVMVKGDRSGKLTVYCGANDIGQGSDAMLTWVIAEETGVPPDDIVVISADTDLTPVDLGAYSSRITYMCGIAAQEAGRNLRAQMQAAVAVAWKVPPERVGVGLGSYYECGEEGSPPTGRQISSREALILAEAAAGTALVASGGYRTRKVGGNYRGGTIGASPAYSTTAHVAEVTVDPDTGVVTVHNVWVAHDCGRALNPQLVEGQIEGSVYMGLAEAMMESHTVDSRGLHTGPNLLDYRIPTSKDCPEIFAKIIETIDPGGPYGAKEAGEGPLHPIIPAIANAIYDATGVRLRRIPFTPDRVLAAMKSLQGA